MSITERTLKIPIESLLVYAMFVKAKKKFIRRGFRNKTRTHNKPMDIIRSVRPR